MVDICIFGLECLVQIVVPVVVGVGVELLVVIYNVFFTCLGLE